MPRLPSTLVAGAAFSALAVTLAAQPPHLDRAGKPVPTVRDLLRRMTPEEKRWQLFMAPGDPANSGSDYRAGAFGLQIAPDSEPPGLAPGEAAKRHAMKINRIQRYFVERSRLGIPIVPFEEALHGLVRPGATAFPQAIGLAATWDTALVGRVARAIARETRSRGIRQVLSPVVNLANDVRWGRTEETYGEDPLLASAMGVAFVAGLERLGVVATPKHFVANVGDGGRDSYPIEFGPRLLEEYFLPPFRAVIERGGARSIMTAYNSVDGSPASQNAELLNGLLKGRWRFPGFVISDASAVGAAPVLHYTEPDYAAAGRHAIEAGLDVIFETSYAQHRLYWPGLARVQPAVIDSAVARVLRAKQSLGLFTRPYADPDSAAYWNGHPDHRRLALEAARASIVLLKNENGTLPFPATGSIAVIGDDATAARLGGYSGPGNAPVSIVGAIRSRSGLRVITAPGVPRVETSWRTVPAANLTTPSGDHGLRGEYFATPVIGGPPAALRTDPGIDVRWTLAPPAPELPLDWYAVRWTGQLLVPVDGIRRLGLIGNDGFRLYLDGKLLIDRWAKTTFRRELAPVDLAAGRRYDLRVEYHSAVGGTQLKLVWDQGESAPSPASIDAAVAAARATDRSVVVVGIEEGEFRDRSSLALPGRQAELIRAVAGVGKPMVVVIVGGSAVMMDDWLERTPAVVDAWYAGEQGGTAVADVLFGDYDPAGRLPVTFPASEGQLPLRYDHKPTGRGDDYLDRSGMPLFPFGHGLSYTTFEYDSLRIEPATITPAGTAVVRVRIRNTGDRAGDEVAQLYFRDEVASVARPVLQLAGFTRVHLAAGATRVVEFPLGPEQLRFLDARMRWVVEPGAVRVLVGRSSADLRVRGTLTVADGSVRPRRE